MMIIRRSLYASLLAICIGTAWAAAGTIRVNSAAELKTALKSAGAGAIIEVADGRYDLGGTLLLHSGGVEDDPIVVRAANRGKAIFTGDSRFRLEGVGYVTIEGFDFSSTEGPAVELRGCHHVRITRNVFHLQETRRSSWVMIDGIKGDTTRLSHHNRVDHNLFEKKSVLGNFVTVEGTKGDVPRVSRHDRIDRNHFRDIGPRAENVLEAIRIGSSDFSLSSGFTVLEDNLFERCDGDPEYISIKSSDDTVRGNTFRECLGSLSLRHGNRSVVDGNFILGNGRTGTFLDSTGKHWTLGTGGIRFCGDDMRFVNNYLEGLTGREWDAAFAIIGGDAEYGQGMSLTKHYRIHRAVIAHNTLVNNASGLEIGYNGGGFQGNWWPMAPEGMTIAKNIIVGRVDTLIKIYNMPVNTKWWGNIAFATGSAIVAPSVPDGIRMGDPGLVHDGEIWRLGAKSPGIDATGEDVSGVPIDIDGQPRTMPHDIGADEFSDAAKLRRPLTAVDVGPDAP